MKKMIFIIILSLSFLSKNHAQHAIGIKGNMTASYLHPSYNLNGNLPLIFPVLPNLELNYMFQKDDQTSFVFGAGIGHLLYYSQHINDFFPDEQFIDDYFYLKIPIQYRKHLRDKFYIGTGVNARIAMFSTTHSLNSTVSDRIRPAYENRNFQLEAVGVAGLQFDFWKFSCYLGMFAEVPLIHREYFNLGIETGLFYDF